MKYGIPYMGSKNAIAHEIVSAIPSADVFVDVFAGGCAITHAALLQGRWKKYIINDIDPRPTDIFCKAINGEFSEKYFTPKWISREEFHERKQDDGYIAYCWSFGNNGESYLYGEDVEPMKKAIWEYVVDNNPDVLERLTKVSLPRDASRERRKKILRTLSRLMVERLGLQSLQRLERLESLERLQSLERLERLQSLQRLERLESLESDYKQLNIPSNSVIYCDPPYLATAEYAYGINHEEFYDWIRNNEYMTFVSEYQMPTDFVPVWSKKKNCSFSSTSSTETTEVLFLHEKWVDEYSRKMGRMFL